MSRYTKAKIERISKNTGFVIKPGNVSFSQKDAKTILDKYYYEGQRNRTDSGELHISRHAMNLNTGNWQDYSQIHFAKVGNVIYLVNGYHRLSGLVKAKSGMVASFNVVIKDCKDMAEVERYYAGFDSKSVVRHRSEQQAVKAVDLSGQLEVLERVAKCAYKAVPIINNDLRIISNDDWDNKVLLGILPHRVDSVMEYKNEIQKWNKIIGKAKGYLKTLMLNPLVTAVALYTLNHCPVDAEDFWSSIADNDGLKKGDPARALYQFLVSRKATSSSNETIKSIALAWNAYMENRSITNLVPGNFQNFYISGTPVKWKK